MNLKVASMSRQMICEFPAHAGMNLAGAWIGGYGEQSSPHTRG